MRETVALELSFVNSNLQLLKEQLAELNSSVEVYQNGTGEEPEIPMIPLGLKETKEIDFREPFKVMKYFDLQFTKIHLIFKGQLISKCLLGVIISTKKPTKSF